MFLSVVMCTGVLMPEPRPEASVCPGAGLTCGSDLSDLAAGSRTWSSAKAAKA